MVEQNDQQLIIISDKLKNLLQKKMDAIPKGFNETRFLQNCLTVLSEVKDIQKYDPRSVARTMLKGAFLGLDFFNRECYAIPYVNNLNFQTDYKGEIKVCKRWSTKPISDIYAKCVREGDDFEAKIISGKQIVNFTPKNFNDGPTIGAFAVVYFEDGSMLYDTMSKAEIEHVRKTYSKAENSPAWKNSPDEMYKKTVIRRLCKLIDLDFDNADQRAAFDDATDTDPKKLKEVIDVTVPDPFSDKSRSDKGDPRFSDSSRSTYPEFVGEKDQKLYDDLRIKYPDEEDWQIEVRMKEIKNANG